MVKRPSTNADPLTAAGFGDKWSSYDHEGLSRAEYERVFQGYSGIFLFDVLPPRALKPTQ